MVNWFLVASAEKNSVAAYASIDNTDLLYRVLSKWLIRGSASSLLGNFWEYLDQTDGDLEVALLDQLQTQAGEKTAETQVTIVRLKDYAVHFTAECIRSTDAHLISTIECELYMYLPSINKKTLIDSKKIVLTLINNLRALENISVNSVAMTPAPGPDPRKKVEKRRSKTTATF